MNQKKKIPQKFRNYTSYNHQLGNDTLVWKNIAQSNLRELPPLSLEVFMAYGTPCQHSLPRKVLEALPRVLLSFLFTTTKFHTPSILVIRIFIKSGNI